MTTADLFGVQLPVLAAGYKHPLILPSRTHRNALVGPGFSRTVTELAGSL